MDKTFDEHLGQAENLSSLFIAMHDEVFSIRELAVCTIGRLSSVNPAYAMPSLRKTLIQVQNRTFRSIETPSSSFSPIQPVNIAYPHLIRLICDLIRFSADNRA